MEFIFLIHFALFKKNIKIIYKKIWSNQPLFITKYNIKNKIPKSFFIFFYK